MGDTILLCWDTIVVHGDITVLKGDTTVLDGGYNRLVLTSSNNAFHLILVCDFFRRVKMVAILALEKLNFGIRERILHTVKSTCKAKLAWRWKLNLLYKNCTWSNLSQFIGISTIIVDALLDLRENKEKHVRCLYSSLWKIQHTPDICNNSEKTALSRQKFKL